MKQKDIWMACKYTKPPLTIHSIWATNKTPNRWINPQKMPNSK